MTEIRPKYIGKISENVELYFHVYFENHLISFLMSFLATVTALKLCDLHFVEQLSFSFLHFKDHCT
jgi:hypothetical protein